MEITANASSRFEWDLLTGSGARSRAVASELDAFANSSSRRGLSVLLSAAMLATMMAPYGESFVERSTGVRRIHLSHSGTDDLLQKSTAQSVTPLTRSLEEIELRLHLTKSQIAQALRVERATLYQWFRGVQPRARTQDRLDMLRQFAAEWSAAGLGSARASWHLRNTNGITLGELLSAETFDWDSLRAFIKDAASGNQQLQPAGFEGIAGFPPESKAEELRRRRDRYPGRFADD